MPVIAQTVPTENKHYYKLETPVPTANSDKKIEVVEFFWFGCPHCSSLNSALETWVKKLPSDVSFKQVHINFGDRTDVHQRLFLTLEAMGLTNQIPFVFTDIHANGKRMMTREEVLAWAKSRNLDLAKFTAIFDDRFTMNRKKSLVTQLQTAYKVDGVPHFGVNGQYITSPSIAKGETEFFNTLNFLIQTIRNKRVSINKAVSINTPPTTFVGNHKTKQLVPK